MITNFSNRLKLASIIIFVAICTSQVQAGWNLQKTFDFLPFVKTPEPETLMITGNYAKSRLLAEVAQLKTEEPILLFSGQENGEKLYYMPAQPEARELSTSKLGEFISIIGPEQVVVIGGEEYVAKKYVKKLKNRFPTIVISGDDWLYNAQAVGRVIDYPGIVDVYKTYLGEMLRQEMPQGTPNKGSAVKENLLQQ